MVKMPTDRLSATSQSNVAIDMKLKYLKSLEDDLAAAYGQMMSSTSEVERTRLQRQIDGLEREIAEVKGQLDHAAELQHAAEKSPQASQPADPNSAQSQSVIAALERRLAEERVNLRLIEERKSQYVLEVDVPLQLIKEEQRLRERIAKLEQQLRL